MQEAERAFGRTRAHPKDKRVLLVDSPDDLCVINLPGIKAAEWRRDMPRDIAKAINIADYKLKAPPPPAPHRFLLPLKLERAFRRDRTMLKTLFERVTNTPPQHENSSASECFMGQGEQIHYTEIPHADSVFVKRMVTVYTSDHRLGTAWYPGDLPDTAREMLKKNMEDTYNLSPTGQAIVTSALRDAYHCQHVTPGHILILKGMEGGSVPEEQLFHHGMEGRPGIYRRACLFGSFP